jgi:hypothetical protein
MFLLERSSCGLFSMTIYSHFPHNLEIIVCVTFVIVKVGSKRVK